MGKRGPKPTPTAIKVAAGNPGHRPLNPDEPQPEIEIPPCPAHLADDPPALAEWNAITKLLDDLGVIAQVDGTALALYCQSYSRYLRAAEEFKKAGSEFVITMSTGVKAQNPLLRVMKEELKIINTLLQQFGMSPSSRTGIKINKKQGKLKRFLGAA